MLLDIKKRIVLLSMPAPEGCVEEIAKVKPLFEAISKKIAVSEQEIEKLGITKSMDGSIAIAKLAEDVALEVDFNDDELSFIKEMVKKLNDDKKVTFFNVELCQAFL